MLNCGRRGAGGRTVMVPSRYGAPYPAIETWSPLSAHQRAPPRAETWRANISVLPSRSARFAPDICRVLEAILQGTVFIPFLRDVGCLAYRRSPFRNQMVTKSIPSLHNAGIDASWATSQSADASTREAIMKVRIRTREHTADAIINVEREVLSLRQAKRIFRALQSAIPDIGLEMVVTQAQGGGVEAGHRIDHTSMD